MILDNLKKIRLPAFHFSIVAFQVDKYRPVLIILIITSALYACVGIFYKLISLNMIRTRMEGKTIAQAAGDTIKRESLEFYKVIPERNLFGSTDKTVAEKQGGKGANASDLGMLLDIKGTVAGDTAYGHAVIEEKAKKKQGLYKVGATVAGATLVKIMRNAVVFKVGEQEKILRMQETMEAPLLPPVKDIKGGISQGTAASPPIVINRKEINANLKDIGIFLSQADIRPNSTGGIADGLMISGVKQGSIYQTIGLSNGDVIQGINDRKMQSAGDVTELFNILKSASGMHIRIKRKGKEETLNYIVK
jgi:type II secretion system protein C